MRRVLPLGVLLFALCAFPASAVLDTNNNGLSDLWERTYNDGDLFPSTDFPYGLQDDTDGDGWTNAQEAAAGTNPFDANPPDGLIRPDIEYIPGFWSDVDNDNELELVPASIRITWPTIHGKLYTLLCSPDLTEWLSVEDWTFIGDGSPAEYIITIPQDDKLFWRVKIEDVDSDSDGLTDAEEAALGTGAESSETLAGYPDMWLAEHYWATLLCDGLSSLDLDGDPDDDGLTNAQEDMLGTNPAVSDNPGIVQDSIKNGNFSDPVIGSGERPVHDPTWSQDQTWDYWEGLPLDAEGKTSWTAVVGTNIEYQIRSSKDGCGQYVELKAEPENNSGITQEVGTRIGVTYMMMLDCRTRDVIAPGQALAPEENNFDVKIQLKKEEGSKPAEEQVEHVTFQSEQGWENKQFVFTAKDLITKISLIPVNNPSDTVGCLVDNVKIVPFDIETASIRNGQFVVNVPDVHQGASGTLDLILSRQGSTSNEVILKTLTNQASGRVTITLDDIMNCDPSPLDGEDALRFDRAKARWRTGNIDVTSGDRNLDVHAVEVLARRRISNYFSPTWGGTWDGNSLQKGVYPAGQFPAGLYNAVRKTEFLNALDPQNEGLAMDENTVIRDQVRPAHNGFNRVIYLNGNDQGYIENPDRDQRNTATASTVSLLRATSVAVRTDADRLSYQTADEVYIPEFSLRTVDDSGTLHGNTDQIDVWRGQGDQTLQNTVDNFGIRRRTCLKIIRAPEP